MGYRLNHIDEPIFMAVPKPMQTELDIHYRLESYVFTLRTISVLSQISRSLFTMWLFHSVHVIENVGYVQLSATALCIVWLWLSNAFLLHFTWQVISPTTVISDGSCPLPLPTRPKARYFLPPCFLYQEIILPRTPLYVSHLKLLMYAWRGVDTQQ